MGKGFQHLKEMGGRLVPLNLNAHRLTWLGLIWIDVLCIHVKLLLQTDGPIETD
jgi:hypothetical protein